MHVNPLRSRVRRFESWGEAPLSQIVKDFGTGMRHTRINAVRVIHADNPAFGYRFIAKELAARGVTAARILPSPDLDGRVMKC